MPKPVPATNDEPGRGWQIAVALAWLAGFSVFYYSLDLPNNRPLTRADVWEAAASLPELVSPPKPDASAAPQDRVIWNNSGWRFFPQRFDLVAVAAAILAGAWGLGSLLLRFIGAPRDRIEKTVFALGLGLSGLSLLTLGFGLGGWLSRPLVVTVLAAAIVTEVSLRLRPAAPAPLTRDTDRTFLRMRIATVVGIAPFLLAMLLGSLLPSVDFDVNEYHFQGPKEFYQNGRISFLPHNVYTSFPFGTEMLTLLAMVLRQDWSRGAIAGKCVLMCFGPLTALALYAAGRRWFNPRVGLIAAFVYLTTPWVYRISTIAYVEGALCCYLFLALFAVMRGCDGIDVETERGRGNSDWLLAGLFAGSAMACKYTGVVQVVFPMFAATVVLAEICRRRRRETRLSERKTVFRAVAAFVVGVLITIGPWLVKNLVETGNPVYPLAYTVFGGRDWDAAMNAKWKAGHSPADFSTANFARSLVDVAGLNDWHSALLFGLAPLALLRRDRRRLSTWVWAYAGYLFLTWWLFTHRIDRFWVPLIPVVSLLAGIGASWLLELGALSYDAGGAVANPAESWLEPRLQQLGRWAALCVLASGALFNLTIVVSGIGGYNQFLLDLELAGQHAAQVTSPQIVFLNDHLPPGSKVLCVGEAQVFYARFPAVYNTVFDRSIFEQWMARQDVIDGAGRFELLPPEEIRRKLSDEGITHVFVNWLEILRYRAPGSYGYTDFVTPERFDQLRQLGVLAPAWQIPESHLPVEDLLKRDPNREDVIKQWGRGLVRPFAGRRTFVTYEVYPVAR